VLNPRKLAAIDIAFLGAKVVIAEYASAVLVAPALGVLTLLRGSGYGRLALGLYLIALGINYVPMLAYAAVISKGRSARAEIGGELGDQRRAMAKYRRQSLFLLVPLVVPIAALRIGEWGVRQ